MSIRQLWQEGKLKISAPANPTRITQLSLGNKTRAYIDLSKPRTEQSLAKAPTPSEDSQLEPDEPGLKRITIAREARDLYDYSQAAPSPYSDPKLFFQLRQDYAAPTHSFDSTSEDAIYGLRDVSGTPSPSLEGAWPLDTTPPPLINPKPWSFDAIAPSTLNDPKPLQTVQPGIMQSPSGRSQASIQDVLQSYVDREGVNVDPADAEEGSTDLFPGWSDWEAREGKRTMHGLPEPPMSQNTKLEWRKEVPKKESIPPLPIVDMSSGTLVAQSSGTRPVFWNQSSGTRMSSHDHPYYTQSSFRLLDLESPRAEKNAMMASRVTSEQSISLSSSQALGSTSRLSIEWMPSTYGLTRGHRDYKEVNPRLLQFVDSLGHGSLGVVDEVRVSQEYPSFVRKRVQIPFNRRKQYLNIMKQEAQVLQDLSHSHIVKMLGSYAEIPDNCTGRQFYSLLMAPVGERDLKTFLDMVGDESTTQTLEWIKDRRVWLLNWFKCLSSALAYLHGQGVRHQDIKPSNIIHRQSEIYFTDFSSATQFQIGQTTSTENPARTSAMYAAPEVINSDGTLNRHGRGTDVFALGAVFTEMMAVLLESSIEDYHKFLASSQPRDSDGRSTSSPVPRQTFLYGRKLERIHTFFANHEFYSNCIAPMLKVDRESRPDAQSVARNIRGHDGPGWRFRGCHCDVEAL
ncbi:kinase-like domain-containing protein [Clohesyomyces aquaticus]|uniref:Kinase-like domain-containing protein n=1 Tax=Clohesyomyces aquaticus TaxID=1231657 RepID=A0A1Y2A1V7_9PLEO|nr:kinase-like domain-containing protein [Clohesyomyces aquaticus]